MVREFQDKSPYEEKTIKHKRLRWVWATVYTPQKCYSLSYDWNVHHNKAAHDTLDDAVIMDCSLHWR